MRPSAQWISAGSSLRREWLQLQKLHPESLSVLKLSTEWGLGDGALQPATAFSVPVW